MIPGDFAHGLPDDVSVGIKPRHNAVTVGRESDLLDRHAAGDGSAHGCGRVPQIAGAVRSDVDVTIRLLHGISAGALKEKLGSCAVRGAKMSADREPRCGDFFEDIKRIGDRPQMNVQKALLFDGDGGLSDLRQQAQDGLGRGERSVGVSHGKFGAEHFGDESHVVSYALRECYRRIAEA